MRPIIGVNDDCLWLCGDVCHSPHPYLPPEETWEKLRYRSMLCHRDRSRVKLSFRAPPGVATRLRLLSELHVGPHAAAHRTREGGYPISPLATLLCGARSGSNRRALPFRK